MAKRAFRRPFPFSSLQSVMYVIGLLRSRCACVGRERSSSPPPRRRRSEAKSRAAKLCDSQLRGEGLPTGLWRSEGAQAQTRDAVAARRASQAAVSTQHARKPGLPSPAPCAPQHTPARDAPPRIPTLLRPASAVRRQRPPEQTNTASSSPAISPGRQGAFPDLRSLSDLRNLPLVTQNLKKATALAIAAALPVAALPRAGRCRAALSHRGAWQGPAHPAGPGCAARAQHVPAPPSSWGGGRELPRRSQTPALVGPGASQLRLRGGWEFHNRCFSFAQDAPFSR